MLPPPLPGPPPLPTASPTPPLTGQGLWRMGPVLVAVNGVHLPPCCIKTGGAIDQFVRCRVAWNPTSDKVRIALGGPERLALAALSAQRGALYVGVSTAVLTSLRRWRIIAGVGCGLIPIAVMTYAFNHTENSTIAFSAIFPALILVALWIALLLPRLNLLKPWRIDGQFVFLKNLHPAVLEGLPEWPK